MSRQELLDEACQAAIPRVEQTCLHNRASSSDLPGEHMSPSNGHMLASEQLEQLVGQRSQARRRDNRICIEIVYLAVSEKGEGAAMLLKASQCQSEEEKEDV